MYNLEDIVNAVGADSAAIMAPNPTEEHLYCLDSFNMPPEWVALINPFSAYSSQGNQHVYKENVPSMVNNECKIFHGHYMESFLIVPVHNNGQVIATLELVNSEKGKTFSEEDLQKAIVLAKQIEL